jgi:hypothetical protein
MNEIQGQEERSEVEPGTILSEMKRVIEIAIPGITLTQRLGDPQPITTEFDADELGDGGAAHLLKSTQVRSPGMWIEFNGEAWRGADVTSSDVTPRRWIVLAVQLLSDIQDTISEATAHPWPEVRLDGRRTHASIGAALEGRFLRMWFGDRDHPVVLFEPVEVIKATIGDANYGH